MKEIFGIDLGTTNSCVAVIGEDGMPQIIKNLEDDYTTPSVVYYDETGEIYVGKEAKNGMKGAPERTIAFIKREMSNTSYSVDIDGDTKTPVGVSAVILKKIVDDANEQRSYEGLSPIKKAVITVPAYFGHNERELTKQAGQIAGLEVLDLLNEPTAAALSYGAKGLEGKTFMVYDLGGGTFDVSIMRMKNGVLDTLSTDGDHRLGGVDWDIALLDFALQSCGLGLSYDDIKDERDVSAMLQAAELCKKSLSKSEKAIIRLLYKRKPYQTEISRAVFEEITEELLENTVDMMHHAIKIAREQISANDIDEIILVGGSSYMPMVRRRLQKEFNCNIRLDMFEPDRAIAQGAAIHAASLVGEKQVAVIGDDMGSRSYGVRTCITEWDHKEGVLNLLKRTDSIVYEGMTPLYTATEGQDAVSLAIYENTSTDDHVLLSKCILIEEKLLKWGFPVPEGTELQVYVRRGKDGLIHVWGECQNKRVDFHIVPEGLMSAAEAEALRKELEGKRV